jgi:hypothetical protein
MTRIHIVSANETLSAIARYYYGDAALYPPTRTPDMSLCCLSHLVVNNFV